MNCHQNIKVHHSVIYLYHTYNIDSQYQHEHQSFESTINDVLAQAIFRKIEIFKFVTLIIYGENNVYPC